MSNARILDNVVTSLKTFGKILLNKGKIQLTFLNNERVECYQYFKIVAVPWRLSVLHFKLDLDFFVFKGALNKRTYQLLSLSIMFVLPYAKVMQVYLQSDSLLRKKNDDINSDRCKKAILKMLYTRTVTKMFTCNTVFFCPSMFNYFLMSFPFCQHKRYCIQDKRTCKPLANCTKLQFFHGVTLKFNILVL